MQEDAIVRAAVHPAEASSPLRACSLSRRLELCLGKGYVMLAGRTACFFLRSLDWSFCRLATKARLDMGCVNTDHGGADLACRLHAVSDHIGDDPRWSRLRDGCSILAGRYYRTGTSCALVQASL